MEKKAKESVMVHHFTAALFDDPQKAKEAVKVLVEKGFGKGEISVIGRLNKEKIDEVALSKVESDVLFWGAQGGIWGSILGLLIGGALFTVPGIGPIAGAGTIGGALAGMISGAAAGATAVGLVDGLIEWGLSRAKAEEYKQRIEEGKVILFVKGSLQKTEDASVILRELSAQVEHQ